MRMAEENRWFLRENQRISDDRLRLQRCIKNLMCAEEIIRGVRGLTETVKLLNETRVSKGKSKETMDEEEAEAAMVVQQLGEVLELFDHADITDIREIRERLIGLMRRMK